MRDWLALPIDTNAGGSPSTSSSSTKTIGNSSDEGITTDQDDIIHENASTEQEELQVTDCRNNHQGKGLSTWLSILNVFGAAKKMQKKPTPPSSSTSSRCIKKPREITPKPEVEVLPISETTKYDTEEQVDASNSETTKDDIDVSNIETAKDDIKEQIDVSDSETTKEEVGVSNNETTKDDIKEQIDVSHNETIKEEVGVSNNETTKDDIKEQIDVSHNETIKEEVGVSNNEATKDDIKEQVDVSISETTKDAIEEEEEEEEETTHLQRTLSSSSIASSTDTDNSTPASSQIMRSSSTPSKYHHAMPMSQSTHVKICWNHGGKQVQVTGEFDNWSAPVDLVPDTENPNCHIVDISMDLSKDIEFKFIVDGEWCYASDLPHRTDGGGNVNNVIYKKEDLATAVFVQE